MMFLYLLPVGSTMTSHKQRSNIVRNYQTFALCFSIVLALGFSPDAQNGFECDSYLGMPLKFKRNHLVYEDRQLIAVNGPSKFQPETCSFENVFKMCWRFTFNANCKTVGCNEQCEMPILAHCHLETELRVHAHSDDRAQCREFWIQPDMLSVHTFFLLFLAKKKQYRDQLYAQ